MLLGFQYFFCTARTDFQQFIQTRNLSDSSILHINKVSFVCDIPFDKKEFFYMTDLKSCSDTTVGAVKQACGHLKKKRRLKQFRVTIQACDDGYNIRFVLQFTWIFKKQDPCLLPDNKSLAICLCSKSWQI